MIVNISVNHFILYYNFMDYGQILFCESKYDFTKSVLFLYVPFYHQLRLRITALFIIQNTT